MLRESRRGRSRGAPGPTTALVTARLRRLVDDAHDGNLMEAAAHADVPYSALRELHSGRLSRGAAGFLGKIAAAYGLPSDWFTAPDDGTVPCAAWAALLPDRVPGRAGRRVTIPFGAWPLIRVLVRLEQRLRDQPPHPDRPILGDATDPRECRRRLVGFLLQPVTTAQQLGTTDVRWDSPPFPGPADFGGPEAARSVGMLRDLGRFWEGALATLLDDTGPRSAAAH